MNVSVKLGFPLVEMEHVPPLGWKRTRAGIFGDCMRACVASVLGLPREEVPHFVQQAWDLGDRTSSGWWALLRDWAQRRGGDFMATYEVWDNYPNLTIADGVSMRGTPHVVVADAQGNPFYDPHPMGGGLIELRGYFLWCAPYAGGWPDSTPHMLDKLELAT